MLKKKNRVGAGGGIGWRFGFDLQFDLGVGWKLQIFTGKRFPGEFQYIFKE